MVRTRAPRRLAAFTLSLLAVTVLATLLTVTLLSSTSGPMDSETPRVQDLSGRGSDPRADLDSFGFTSFDAGTIPEEGANALPNDYDLAFAVMMIPHHQSAVDMADMLLMTDGLDPLIRQLGEWIIKDQRTEIDLMTEFVEAWDKAHPELDAWHPDEAAIAAVGDGMGGMTHEHGTMGSSPGFATYGFLTQMIPHHEGAIEMCRVTLVNGVNAFVKSLCTHIISEQAVELEAMEKLLRDYP